MPLPPEELKRRLDAFRTLRGMRQIDLAALLEADGHGKHDLGRLERGDPRVPFSPSIRRSIATHLRIPEHWLTDTELDFTRPPSDQALDESHLDLDSRQFIRHLANDVIDSSAARAQDLNDKLDRNGQRLDAIDGAIRERNEMVQNILGPAVDSFNSRLETLEDAVGKLQVSDDAIATLESLSRDLARQMSEARGTRSADAGGPDDRAAEG